MNIKRIMSFIALAIFSSGVVFANVNDEKLLEKTSFDAVNNESKENDFDIKKEIDQLPRITNEKKEIKNKGFAYVNFDATYIIPSHIGFGYRKQINNNGFDFGIAASPLPLLFSSAILFDIHGSGLKYFPSNNKNNNYFTYGLNLSGNSYDKSNYFFISPSWGWGKQYNNKISSFFECKMNWPNIPVSNKHYSFDLLGPLMMFLPVITISYGFGF